jgi:hypothetical protein
MGTKMAKLNSHTRVRRTTKSNCNNIPSRGFSARYALAQGAEIFWAIATTKRSLRESHTLAAPALHRSSFPNLGSPI